MATTMQRESTDYIYFGIGGTVPTTAEVAFLVAGTRPTDTDWTDGTLVTASSNPLWADAQASGVKGTYFVARLVGTYNSNDVHPGQGDWQPWLRLTGATEQHVMIAPTVLTIA